MTLIDSGLTRTDFLPRRAIVLNNFVAPQIYMSNFSKTGWLLVTKRTI